MSKKVETYDEFVARGGTVKKEKLVDNLKQIRLMRANKFGGEFHSTNKGGTFKMTSIVGTDFMGKVKR